MQNTNAHWFSTHKQNRATIIFKLQIKCINQFKHKKQTQQSETPQNCKEKKVNVKTWLNISLKPNHKCNLHFTAHLVFHHERSQQTTELLWRLCTPFLLTVIKHNTTLC